MGKQKPSAVDIFEGKADVTPFSIKYSLLKAELGDVKRAAEFYQLIRYSYASSCDSFGGKPHSMWSNFPLIEQASRRLQKVVIENKDFEKLISSQDSEVSFFYCDPPYFSTEDYYLNVGFSCDDHKRLKNVLKKIRGKFLLSYNDCPEIRELYGGFEKCTHMSD